MADASVPDEVRDHYERAFDEERRIREGLGQLELLRSQEVIRRHLPDGRLHILDVGGGTGIHAEWLLADGHRVHLIDAVDLHVETAIAALWSHDGFSAEVGDARHLREEDDRFDAVLLLGPLYHLVERSDRLLAWSEAGRVVRQGAPVFAAAISRFASLFDGLARDSLFDPRFRAIVEQDLADGQHRNPAGEPEWFTTAYFHHPAELAQEAQEAGLSVRELIGLEGMAAWLPSLDSRWANPTDRQTILYSARAVEREPALLGLSPHLMVVAEPARGGFTDRSDPIGRRAPRSPARSR